jgi:hypothetical protein
LKERFDGISHVVAGSAEVGEHRRQRRDYAVTVDILHVVDAVAGHNTDSPYIGPKEGCVTADG